jgi:hypothetical protein
LLLQVFFSLQLQCASYFGVVETCQSWFLVLSQASGAPSLAIMEPDQNRDSPVNGWHHPDPLEVSLIYFNIMI